MKWVKLPEKMQENLIKSTDWDMLIVLSSCRYDYFKEVSEAYFDEKVHKVTSAGWRPQHGWRKIFGSYYNQGWAFGALGNGDFSDTIYLSSNPHINSTNSKTANINPKEIFHEVIDLWLEGWDREKGTVPPSYVRKRTRSTLKRNPGKRIVSHFIQPHYPYLSLGPLNQFQSGLYSGKEERTIKSELDKYFPISLSSMAKKIMGKKMWERIKLGLNFKQTSPIEIYARNYGLKGLRHAYERELKTVLREIKKLLDNGVSGKVVVTADQGELLGEEGLFGHVSLGNESSTIRDVPWLVFNL